MALRHDLDIRQGETWSWSWAKTSGGSAVDLTGYSARMSIKAGYEGATEAYLSSGSDADGGTITLGGAAGTIALAMTAAQTSELAGDLSYYLFVRPDQQAERYIEMIYDLETVSPAGVVTRELEGRVTIQREVSRA